MIKNHNDALGVCIVVFFRFLCKSKAFGVHFKNVLSYSRL